MLCLLGLLAVLCHCSLRLPAGWQRRAVQCDHGEVRRQSWPTGQVMLLPLCSCIGPHPNPETVTSGMQHACAGFCMLAIQSQQKQYASQSCLHCLWPFVLANHAGLSWQIMQDCISGNCVSPAAIASGPLTRHNPQGMAGAARDARSMEAGEVGSRPGDVQSQPGQGVHSHGEPGPGRLLLRGRRPAGMHSFPAADRRSFVQLECKTRPWCLAPDPAKCC